MATLLVTKATGWSEYGTISRWYGPHLERNRTKGTKTLLEQTLRQLKTSYQVVNEIPTLRWVKNTLTRRTSPRQAEEKEKKREREKKRTIANQQRRKWDLEEKTCLGFSRTEYKPVLLAPFVQRVVDVFRQAGRLRGSALGRLSMVNGEDAERCRERDGTEACNDRHGEPAVCMGKFRPAVFSLA